MILIQIHLKNISCIYFGFGGWFERYYYYIYSNRESGIGRFDVIFIPYDKQKKGMLLEFKNKLRKWSCLKDKAKEALKQIRDKQYTEEF